MSLRRLITTLSFGITLSFSLVGGVATINEQPECGVDPNDPLALDCAQASGLTKNDPRVIVGRIINVVLGILGIIVTVLIVYAGFLWMTAAGNDDQIGKAKSILFSSVIGLLIILSAYSISTFIVKNIYEASTGAGYGAGPIIP